MASVSDWELIEVGQGRPREIIAFEFEDWCDCMLRPPANKFILSIKAPDLDSAVEIAEFNFLNCRNSAITQW